MSNTQEIIYESIDNKFAYAKYGEFKVMMMKDNGYINITKLCKEGKKEFFNWKRLESSKKFLDDFSTEVGIPTPDLLIVINSGNTNVLTRGTYAHPDLVPHVASWISSKFAVYIMKIIKLWRSQNEQNNIDYMNNLSKCIAEEKDNKNTGIESIVRDRLALEVKGNIEIKTEYGIVDIVSDKEIIEVKRLFNWKHALGQILCYKEDEKFSHLTPRLHLFYYDFECEEYNENACKIIKICQKYECVVSFEKLD